MGTFVADCRARNLSGPTMEFQGRVAPERLGIEADELPGGRMLALSHPRELAEQLETYRRAS